MTTRVHNLQHIKLGMDEVELGLQCKLTGTRINLKLTDVDQLVLNGPVEDLFEYVLQLAEAINSVNPMKLSKEKE